MRLYIIGSDGITLCRKAPATLNDGEIAVASNEELHAAQRREAHDAAEKAQSMRVFRGPAARTLVVVGHIDAQPI